LNLAQRVEHHHDDVVGFTSARRKIRTMKSLGHPRFVLARDNFYAEPDRVYQAALDATYYEPEDVTGWRSTTVHHEPGVRARLQKLLGVRITRWDTDPLEGNGVFYMGLARGRRKEVPAVHYDHPADDITIVVYLTPGLPADCGTSLWMHRNTGLTDMATASDARRLGRSRTALLELLERDSRYRKRWIEVDRIGYRFNRMVAYPSGQLHSATRHHGALLRTGRIFQTFRIGVDWSTLNPRLPSKAHGIGAPDRRSR
jgi:Family of unknown function (DUF6445)